MSILRPNRAALAAGLCLVILSSPKAQDADIVLTPGRSPQAIARAGSAVTVIRAEEIEKAGVKSTADLLRDVPGVFVVEDGGPGQTARVRMRGSDVAHTLVLIDGVRINDPSNTDGHFDFASLVPADIERIEVLRGPQSALYGSDAIGGVINIITRKGRGETRAFAEIEGGRYGTLSGRAGISGGTKEFDYALSISGAQSDGFSSYGYRIPRITRLLSAPLEADGFARWGGMAKFAWRPVEGAEIEAGFSHTHSRNQFDSTFWPYDVPNLTWGKSTTGYVKASHLMFDGRLKNSLHAYSHMIDRDYVFPDPFWPAWAGYQGVRSGLTYQGDLKLDAFGTLIFGAQIERERIRAIGTYSPDPINASRVTRSLFALHQLPIGSQFDLSLGGRIDDIENGDRFATWRATAAYRFPDWGTKLRASAGTGGKAPALDQLYNPSYGNPKLTSERSTGFDAGIDQSLFGGRLNLSLTAFHNRYSDLIQYSSGGCAPYFGYGCHFNVAKAETSGVEISADAVLIEGLVSLRGQYTYLLSEDASTGLTLVRRPKHNGSLSLRITPMDKLTITPSVRMVGARVDRTSDPMTFQLVRVRLAPYARLDVRADYQLHKNLNLFLRAENLTGTRYQEVYTYGTTGRALYAGARATW